MHIIVKELKKKTLNSNSIAKAFKNGSRMSDLAPLDPGVERDYRVTTDRHTFSAPGH